MSKYTKLIEASLGALKNLNPLGLFHTSAPTDTGRRTLLKGAVAAPVVAGSLSKIPLGKVIDEFAPATPVLKKVEDVIRLTDLPQMQKVLVKGNLEDGQIDFDDISDTLERKVESIDDLNDKELNKVFEDTFFADGKPVDLFEEEIREEMADGIDSLTHASSELTEMNPEDAENLLSSMFYGDFNPEYFKDFPEAEFLDNFIKEMKLSGYSDKQVDEIITNMMNTEK